MEYNNEANYLMLSGIQHFQFCKRQWALIHIEQQWKENVRTIEGQYIHRNVDQPFKREKRGKKFVVRGMPVKSNELKIVGVCDVVEFVQDPSGVQIAGKNDKYLAFPVEYKRGRPKKDDSDILQLTAQAMCLEEMLLCEVKKGYIFYNEIKHRVEVPVTENRKNTVRQVCSEMHFYFERKHTPKVKAGPHCKNCSLNDICLPRLMRKESVRNYINRKINE